MRIHDWTLKILLGLALVGVVTGCGKSDDKMQGKAPAPPPQASAPAPPAGTPAAPPAAPAPQSALPVAASPATAAAASAVATTDGETPGTRIEVQELKRSSGGSVTLRFLLINNSDKPIDMHPYLSGDDTRRDTRSVAGITLVDAIGKKKYFVLRDSEGACLCSHAFEDLASSGRLSLWAKFPAPPDNVDKISVIVPHFAPMDDVPLGR